MADALADSKGGLRRCIHICLICAVMPAKIVRAGVVALCQKPDDGLGLALAAVGLAVIEVLQDEAGTAHNAAFLD